ncbi:MAG TPA: hypothetical protein ENK18_18505 [Deltaproteobacteria bacterium]|nr:hypothetical protein [Deltaproteobacteria bacterium]
MLVAGGGIEAEGNRLAWADQATEIPCPELAKTAADGVLRDLPVLWRRLLEALAVIDDAASAPLLAEVLGWEPDPVITILEGLDRRGVLRWTPDQTPTLAWRHPRLAPLLLERMHPSRRAALHRSLALAMTDRAPSHSAVAALMAVGDLEQAARIATSLATELLQGHRVRSAQELLEPLVDALRSTDQTIEIAEVLLSYTCCLQRIHPTDPRNVRTLLRVREIAEACADPILQVRVDLAQARLYQNIGHYGNYLKYLLAGWEHLSSTHDPALTAALATELARSHRWRGDVPKAEGWVEEALVAAEASGRLSLLGDAVVQSGACMLARGQLSDAEQAYGLAMEDYERGFDRPGYFVALARWASSLRLQGRYSEALAQLYRHLPEASQLQDPAAYVELLQSTAWVELDLSRLGRAQECTDELTATISKGEHLHLRLETQLLTGRILLASGQPQMASYLLQQVQQRARNAELSVLAEAARSLLAETMFALGDHRTAATLFQSAILGLLGSGDLAVLAEGVRACARTQATRRDPSDIFRPVERLVEEQPMTLLKLEQLLAYGAWYRARGERERSRQSFREAAMVLNVLATSLNDTDRAALRVHPWSTWIRRGLRQGHR